MTFILIAFAGLAGFVGGAVSVWVITEQQRSRLNEQRREQTERANHLAELKATLGTREATLRKSEGELQTQTASFDAQARAFHASRVTFEDLAGENRLLKRDLRNVTVNANKLALDHAALDAQHQRIEIRTTELGRDYLQDHVRWIGRSLTPSNFATAKQRLLKVVNDVREIGMDVPFSEEARLVNDLKSEFERVVKAALEREEQARIRAQIREEQKILRETERELQRIAQERAAIEKALRDALARTKDEHNAEVEYLRAQLASAEERAARAVSQAQLTKAGHVYVISNLGSFGTDVFKVGMTRRLEPLDHVCELGDASVPFPFDVHMMISSQDAPALENALHRGLHKRRLNKSNPRKEFFKTDLEAILEIVREHHGEVDYIADAEALEYRQSLSMSEEDQEFIEGVYDKLADDGEGEDECTVGMTPLATATPPAST